MNGLLLALSILLSTGRNLCSKQLSALRFGTKAFFVHQGVLFLSGGVALLLFGEISFASLAPAAVGFAIAYGLLLILAQWFYTASLFGGNIALCSTVYSLGFIFPTLSGAVLWSEPFSSLDLLGLLCAVMAVIASGIGKGNKQKTANALCFIPLVVAMLASGGLGIVQKLQQKSTCADQKSTMLLLAFLLAAGFSLLFALLRRDAEQKKPPLGGKFVYAAGVGLFFGCCNLLNTTLAGRMESAIFFPTLNIGVILLSMLCGRLCFGERIRWREAAVLAQTSADLAISAIFSAASSAAVLAVRRAVAVPMRRLAVTISASV